MPQQYQVQYQFERVNQIFNPSFENNAFEGSLFLSTASVINTGAYSGTYALQIVSASALVGADYLTPAGQSKLQIGQQYTASLYVKNTVGATRQMRIAVMTYDSSGVPYWTYAGSNTSVTAGGAYQRLTVTFTAQTQDVTASIRILHQVTGGAVGNTVVIDALMIERLPAAGTYFDGFTTNAYWTGIQNQSPSALRTGIYMTMDNVQQVSASIGRQQLVDNFEPSRMTVSARYPNGFSAPNTALKVDTPIRVIHSGSATVMWTGRIRNVSVTWDKPYVSDTGTGVADFVEIECEGALAQWGRLQGNSLFVGASDLLTQLSNVLAGTNLQYGTTYTAATSPLLSSSTVDDSLSNWLNTACATIGATIKDGSDNNIVGVYGRDWGGNLPVSFSDTTNNSTNQVYDNIVFDSVSSDYFTEIELNTTSYGDVVVTSGVAPHRTFRQTTFSPSASQATDLANYLIGIYGDNGFGISELSCKSEAQNSWNLDLGYAWWDIIGYSTLVTFRGMTFRCTVVGASFTATPNESRFTYYLADIGLTPYLVLDDANAGLLDTNKLGW